MHSKRRRRTTAHPTLGSALFPAVRSGRPNGPVTRCGRARNPDAHVALPLILAVAATTAVLIARPASAGLSIQSDWAINGSRTLAMLGGSVATAGDVNGDGYSDVILGASGLTAPHTLEGAAFVYHGSAAGIDSDLAWLGLGGQTHARYGMAVAPAGDINGDGYDDVLVGAPGWDGAVTDGGKVYLYLGSPSGLYDAAIWSVTGTQSTEKFGSAVAGLGDVNGDGYDDFAIGDASHDAGQVDEGMVWVYYGSMFGPGGSASWSKELNQAGAAFGWSAAPAGDVNGDGYDDLAVGAPFYDGDLVDEGGAFVYLGSSSGLSSNPIWIGEGNQTDARFGASVCTAGDTDGDGYSDLLVAASGYSGLYQDEGRAYLFEGRSTGLTTTPTWTFESNDPSASLADVATAGDSDGDGYADVIVSAVWYTPELVQRGKAWAFRGGFSGLGSSPVWTAEGTQDGALFGSSIATAGDTNGDGLSEVLIGIPMYTEVYGNVGRVQHYGSFADDLASGAYWVEEDDEAYAAVGQAVASGDWNGDGFSDVALGAWLEDNGHTDEGVVRVYDGAATTLSHTTSWVGEGNQTAAGYGISLASAGDVDGDGYEDLVVGAPTYDNGQTNEGRAFLYKGSAAGLGTAASWTLESDQANCRYAWSVARAGDVNGDGYADVIVGAPRYTVNFNEEGAAFVHYGSDSGPSPLPSWQALGGQADSDFGYSVAGAGDVDGDGYDDILVGAPFYDHGQTNEGVVFLYLGSPNGLGATPAALLERDQAAALFGVSVAGAGDVDGDAKSDALIGAPAYDSGQTDEGAAFLYLGGAGATGLETTATWWTQSNEAGARMGERVASAGDVDADGFSDILIGAPYASWGETSEGRAYVFRGAAYGIAGGGPAWIGESNQAYSRFGAGVAGAGDVTGDGFSDVIIGAPDHDNGSVDEGRVVVYLGGGRRGLDHATRQVRAEGILAWPVAVLGRSDDTESFRFSVAARSPIGRDQVRLEYEIKPAGQPFDGSTVLLDTWHDTGAPVSGEGSRGGFRELVSGLSPDVAYHWRFRTVTRSPLFPRSMWRTLAGNAAGETDIRTDRMPSAVAHATGGPDSPLRVVSRMPFDREVVLEYHLDRPTELEATVHDVTGRALAVLDRGPRETGTHQIRWDGGISASPGAAGASSSSEGRAANGVYFVRVRTSEAIWTERVVALGR